MFRNEINDPLLSIVPHTVFHRDVKPQNLLTDRRTNLSELQELPVPLWSGSDEFSPHLIQFVSQFAGLVLFLVRLLIEEFAVVGLGTPAHCHIFWHSQN